MSSEALDGKTYPSNASRSPEAPIRKKRQMSLQGPVPSGDLPPRLPPSDEMTRRPSLQPSSRSSPQNLQGQLRTAPPPPVRSSTIDLPYRSVVVPPVTQSPPKPLRKDQVYMFEFACENEGLGIALGIGHHDTLLWKSTVHGNGIIYQRKENGDYFQIEELNTAQDIGLRRGDEVLSINGCMLYKCSLDYAGILLAEAASGGRVKLAITRPKRPPSRADYLGSRQSSQLSESFESVTDSTTSETSTEVTPLLSYSEPFDVDLYKEEDGKSLGIGIVGGLDAPLGPIGFFVKTIYPNGLVGENGRIKTGDEIILLNGVPLQGLRHSEAINKFKVLPSGPVRLTVRSLVHLTGLSQPSSEYIKDSAQGLKNSDSSHSLGSHSLGSASLPSENASSDGLLEEIVHEYGKQEKIEMDFTDFTTGKIFPSGNSTNSSFSTKTTTNSLAPTESLTDVVSSNNVVLQPTERLSNTSVPNAVVTDGEFQSPLVTDVTWFETGSLGFYQNPPFGDAGTVDSKEPDLIVKHRVINPYKDFLVATETAEGKLSDDGLSSDETDFGVSSKLKPGDIFNSYLLSVTKKSSEVSETPTTAEYFDPPHEFTSTMYIVDDSDEDGNGEVVSRSFQNNLGDDKHSSIAVAWSGVQDDDFISGIGVPVGFGDDQRGLSENHSHGVESGTSEPLRKDFDLLGSDPQRLLTEESIFGVKTWSNSGHDSQPKPANGARSLNPFADDASFPNSNAFDSVHRDVVSVRLGAFGAEDVQREPHESISDYSQQDNLSPDETGLSPDTEKWFSDESPDPGSTSNMPPKRLILVGEIELAPPPNFSGVMLNGDDSVDRQPDEHLGEFSVSSRFQKEDVNADRLNGLGHTLNSTSITFEERPHGKESPLVIDSASKIIMEGACVDESNADDWLEDCTPSAKYDSPASFPNLDIRPFSHRETSRLQDPDTVPFSTGDHGATTLLQPSRLSTSPLPPSLFHSNSTDSLLEMSEPPPLPSSAPPPLPDTPPPPPPPMGHRYANDLHLENVAVFDLDLALPPNSLFTDDFGMFSGSDPPAWKGQEFPHDVSHNYSALNDAQQHLSDTHGHEYLPSGYATEYRAGSSKAPSLAVESHMFSSVTDEHAFLSNIHPSASDNGRASIVNSSFTERIIYDPECFPTSEDNMSSSLNGKISSSQTDLATLPESGTQGKLQLTSDITSEDSPLHRQTTFPGRGLTPLVESTFGNNDHHTSGSASKHSVGDPMATEMNIIRSETEPFQVKVNKNPWGLGMKVSGTAKGAVISEIQTNPSGRIGDIRVNDYLLAVNGIGIRNQTTEEIEEFINALPAGIVRLTVSAMPPASTSYRQERFDNQRMLGNLVAQAQNVTPHELSYQMNRISSPPVDPYAASASNVDVFSISRRSISRDEIVGSVLKDYYTVEDKPKEETSNKPKKPLIAQALLPKSKRSGSLVPGMSTPSTPDAWTSRSTSSASSHSECLDVLFPERKLSEGVANSPVFEEPPMIKYPESTNLVAPISSSWSLKTRKLAFEEKDPGELRTKVQTRPADQCKIADSELQLNMGRSAKGVDILPEKDDDDSASVHSDSSSIHSAGQSSQSSENSTLSRSRVLAEVETEYVKKVASSKAFFESIQTDSKKVPSSKQSGSRSDRISEISARPTELQPSLSAERNIVDKDVQDLLLRSESVTPVKETAVDSENLKIAESKAFFKSMENSKKQRGSSVVSLGRDLSDTPVQTPAPYEMPKMPRESRVITEVDSRTIPETESLGKTISPPGVDIKQSPNISPAGADIRQSHMRHEHHLDTKLRESKVDLDSESINVAESKAFFKSMESTSKRSSNPIQSLPVIGSKVVSNITPTTEPRYIKDLKVRGNGGRSDELPRYMTSSEPKSSNDKIQEIKQRQSENETNEVELIKVTETKAFFESLKPSTSSINRDKTKPFKREDSLSHLVSNATAQETVPSTAELKNQPPSVTQKQSQLTEPDKPRAVVQPVSRREPTANVIQHTPGRLPTLPSQKYLPVSSGPQLKPSSTSSSVLRQPQKSMQPGQSNPSSPFSSTLQTADASKERMDIPINSSREDESQEQQKSVGNLVSKFATFSPDPKAVFTGELKQDLQVKRESLGQVRYQHGGVGDSEKSPSAELIGSPASADAGKLKRPIPPLGPPPSVTTPLPSASSMPVIGSSAKSQQWKQFMTNYSSMK